MLEQFLICRNISNRTKTGYYPHQNSGEQHLSLTQTCKTEEGPSLRVLEEWRLSNPARIRCRSSYYSGYNGLTMDYTATGCQTDSLQMFSWPPANQYHLFVLEERPELIKQRIKVSAFSQVSCSLAFLYASWIAALGLKCPVS